MATIIFMLASLTFGFEALQPWTPNVITSCKGKPLGPNSLRNVSIMELSSYKTFGFLIVWPCLTNIFRTSPGETCSARRSKFSEHKFLYLTSPIFSAKNGITRLAALFPTRWELSIILFIKVNPAFIRFMLLSFQSRYCPFINLKLCSIMSRGMPSENSQSANFS